jgi:hypothetical protein
VVIYLPNPIPQLLKFYVRSNKSPQNGGVAAVLASTLAFSSSASAVTLIGNYPQINDSNSTFNIDPTGIKGVGFTLPTGSNYSLNDIVLRLGNYNSSFDTPLLQIYADSAKTSTNPNGATLQGVTFTKPTSSSNAIGNFTFTPNSAFTFLADTRYWLRLSGTTGSNFDWSGSFPGITPTGIAGITVNGFQLSGNGGTSYINSTVLNTFQINATAAAATAVPEPTSLPGYVTLLGGLLAARKIVKFRTAKKVDL